VASTVHRRLEEAGVKVTRLAEILAEQGD